MRKKKGSLYIKAIKKTLAYSAVFGCPLSFYQLTTFLIFEGTEKFDPLKYKKALAWLIHQKLVKVEKELCFLANEKYGEYDKGKECAISITKKNLSLIKLLGKTIPWIKFIGITGSAAALNSKEEGDLDILIISSKNRLWLTRGFTSLILKKVFKNYVKKGIDPNIYIDEANLTWDKNSQNIYIANEIIRMQPIVDKEGIYFKFIHENSWIFDFFPNFIIHFPQKHKEPRTHLSPLVNFLEKVAYKLQINYMKKKKTKEVTRKNFIHFNTNDSAQWVLSEYEKKVYD